MVFPLFDSCKSAPHSTARVHNESRQLIVRFKKTKVFSSLANPHCGSQTLVTDALKIHIEA